MKLLVSLYLIIVLATAGCSFATPFAQISEIEPEKTIFIVNKAPKEVANCALFNLKSQYGLAPTIIERSNEYIILLATQGYLNAVPMNLAVINFRPKEQGTIVELHSNFRAQTLYIWTHVIKCAQNSPGATVGEK